MQIGGITFESNLFATKYDYILISFAGNHDHFSFFERRRKLIALQTLEHYKQSDLWSGCKCKLEKSTTTVPGLNTENPEWFALNRYLWKAASSHSHLLFPLWGKREKHFLQGEKRDIPGRAYNLFGIRFTHPLTRYDALESLKSTKCFVFPHFPSFFVKSHKT